MIRSLLLALLLTLSGASVMAQSRDPQLDPHIFDNLRTDAPFSWLLEKSPQQQAREDFTRREREELERDPPQLPRDRPPHIKPEWEAKLPEWEAMLQRGEVPKDEDFIAYAQERAKQMMKDPEWRRRIDQKTEELRSIINEQMTGVPEEAL